MKRLRVYTGEIYGKWTVLEEEIKIRLHWKRLCCCVCGNKKYIRVVRLVNGTSLGCRSCSSGTLKHGHRRNYKHSSEYISWNNMRIRCYCKSSKDYDNYGGRDIRVCDRWINSFENFLQDMGRKPTRRYSLDRKDNDRGYDPLNCRWATAIEQRHNQRRCKGV